MFPELHYRQPLYPNHTQLIINWKWKYNNFRFIHLTLIFWFGSLVGSIELMPKITEIFKTWSQSTRGNCLRPVTHSIFMGSFWFVSSALQKALQSEREVRGVRWGVIFIGSTFYNPFLLLWEGSIAADDGCPSETPYCRHIHLQSAVQLHT